jgi:hypothetical protein
MHTLLLIFFLIIDSHSHYLKECIYKYTLRHQIDFTLTFNNLITKVTFFYKNIMLNFNIRFLKKIQIEIIKILKISL